MLKSYKNLIVWQKSIALIIEIYRLTGLFPKSELYCLVSQLRRAAVSIASNLAEGFTRKHRQEYVQFARIAFGSGAEIETQLIIAKELRLAPLKEFAQAEVLLNEVMRMLNALINKLVANP